jgi:hypothetical protein
MTTRATQLSGNLTVAVNSEIFERYFDLGLDLGVDKSFLLAYQEVLQIFLALLLTDRAIYPTSLRTSLGKTQVNVLSLLTCDNLVGVPYDTVFAATLLQL